MGYPGGSVVKNPPATRETLVRALGQDDPLKEGLATHSGLLAWRIPWTSSLVGYSPWGHKELATTERLTTAQHRGPRKVLASKDSE